MSNDVCPVCGKTAKEHKNGLFCCPMCGEDYAILCVVTEAVRCEECATTSMDKDTWNTRPDPDIWRWIPDTVRAIICDGEGNGYYIYSKALSMSLHLIGLKDSLFIIKDAGRLPNIKMPGENRIIYREGDK